jgi:uracil-DNA glycosylase family 4
MNESREAIRHYVHFLQERDGVREVLLTKSAREGLARLHAASGPAPAVVAASKPVPPSTRAPATSSAPEAPILSLPAERSTPVAGKIVAWPPNASGPVVAELPVEVSGGTKAEQLRHLGERAAVCVKCAHLAARRHTVVFGVGNPEAKLMFIGEAPGEEEDLKGEPFVGRAGQLLTKMIAAMGLSREDVYIANIVKCRPDMPPGAPGNRKPTRQEMEACVPFLRAQIDVIRPGAMVALGATAVEGLLGPIGTIGSLRGKFLEYRGTPLMATYHPSYLLRNASVTEKRKVWEDLLKVMEKLEMPISEKQRGFFLKA